VTILAAVDQPQFVTQDGPNRVNVDEFNRWAAPLSDNIERVVAQDLVVLLWTADVAAGRARISFLTIPLPSMSSASSPSAPGRPNSTPSGPSAGRLKDSPAPAGPALTRRYLTTLSTLSRLFTAARAMLNDDIAKMICSRITFPGWLTSAAVKFPLAGGCCSCPRPLGIERGAAKAIIAADDE
jgi:hypothetical protein